MKILLDTNALLWLLENHPNLGEKAVKLADTALAASTLYVSAISFWEIALLDARIKPSLSRIAEAFRHAVLNLGITEVPITGDIGILTNRLENLHKDPADRMIIATAITLDAVLITADKAILKCKGKLKSHDARK